MSKKNQYTNAIKQMQLIIACERNEKLAAGTK